MDLEYLRKLVRLVQKSGVTELEIEEEGIRVRLRNEPRHTDHHGPRAEFIAAPPVYAPTLAAPQAAPLPTPTAPVPAPARDLIHIESPMVGTFYRAPAPDAPVFVQAGTTVEPSTVVCIIEAMKVMNEIKAGVSGKIIDILVENGQPVEFGQPLFAVKPE